MQGASAPFSVATLTFIFSPGFNPFATAFSRKSRTQLQERAEQSLANLAEKQASRQQRFSTLEDRHVTILLPQTKSQREADASESETAEMEEGSDEDQRELELVAQLWRERQARDDFERFETAAAKKLRLLRSSKMYPYVLLRVRLPGGVYLQARFTVDESLEVREVIQSPCFHVPTHVYGSVLNTPVTYALSIRALTAFIDHLLLVVVVMVLLVRSSTQRRLRGVRRAR